MLKNNRLKTYRFSDELIEKLDKLKDYNFIESKFVRLAIEEKLKRDLPMLKDKKERIKLPF